MVNFKLHQQLAVSLMREPSTFLQECTGNTVVFLLEWPYNAKLIEMWMFLKLHSSELLWNVLQWQQSILFKLNPVLSKLILILSDWGHSMSYLQVRYWLFVVFPKKPTSNKLSDFFLPKTPSFPENTTWKDMDYSFEWKFCCSVWNSTLLKFY